MNKQHKIKLGIVGCLALGTTLYVLLDFQRTESLFVRSAMIVLLWLIGVASVLLAITSDRVRAKFQSKSAGKNGGPPLRGLVEITNEGIWTVDKELKTSFVNQKLADTLGYGVEEMLGQPIFAFMDDEAKLQVQQYVERHQEGIAEQFEFRLQHKDGSSVWAALSAKPLTDAHGKYLGGMAMLTDITERKTAEEILQECEANHRALLDNARDFIFTLDIEGNFKTVNRAALQLTGYSREEALHMNFAQVVTPESMPLASAIMEVLRDGRSVPVYEVEIATKDRQKVRIEVNSQTIYRKGKPVEIQSIARNITERKRAEAEHQQLQDQLLQAQKMESIGRLASGVAHDFNNLLTVIIGYGQLLFRNLAASDTNRAAAEQIIKAGESAASLTRQLLAFSRRQVLERKVINLNQAIGTLMKMLQRIIGEEVETLFLADDKLPMVFSDYGWIEQVIINLAINARDAMQGGGQLMIKTQAVTLDDAYCKENLWAKPGQYAQISICDDGTGMDAETLQHIFEPFFTTKEEGKGTGLGLAVVFGIIQQHNGLIHVYSEMGIGTTFKVYLPAHQSAFAAPQLQAEEVPLPNGKETILIGEDDETLQRLARSALEGLGYKVLLANNGEEVLRQFTAHRDQIDLLILDMVMPRCGGYEAYQEIQKLNGAMPVIFVTGYSTEMTRHTLVPETNAVVLQKPYGVAELGRKVRALLDAASAKQ
ncbi:MAG: PAS domain S-box protein [Acidobacteria bacterium]|nr:PAS domain S-box protein [Acidobacteriota bacterium]